jgi:hypothetical protein
MDIKKVGRESVYKIQWFKAEANGGLCVHGNNEVVYQLNYFVRVL